eukprot:TRINITY_DN1073_c0_g1_i3.p1 TRINITY_DN1073_c0_g1~~TRINITY_DN1073_c0_g1_i3.p1  ORF type:complete len:166 (-),score=23.81 TRINITY_DN1073_c0_g1_i3:755-1252(-)
MTICVDKQRRKQGLGGELLKVSGSHLLRESRRVNNISQKILFILYRQGCRQVSLHVKADNSKAIDFYKNRGFVIHKLLRNFYNLESTTNDAYEMVIHFRPSVEFHDEEDLKQKVMRITNDHPQPIFEDQTGRVTPIAFFLIFLLFVAFLYLRVQNSFFDGQAKIR